GCRPRLVATGRDGLPENRVDVGHVEQDAHRRAAVVLWPASLDVGMLVGEHDDRVADLDLGMSDSLVGGGNAHDLRGVEGALVEVDGARGPFDDQVRCRAVVAVWNRRHPWGLLGQCVLRSAWSLGSSRWLA